MRSGRRRNTHEVAARELTAGSEIDGVRRASTRVKYGASHEAAALVHPLSSALELTHEGSARRRQR